MRPGSGRPIFLGILLAGAIGFLLFALRGGGGPGEQRAATRSKPRTTAKAKAGPPAPPADPGWDRYEMIVARNVFGQPAPAPSPVPSAAAGGNIPPPPLPIPEPPSPSSGAPAPTTAPPLSFPGWSFAGFLEIDGQPRAILQNESDQASEILRVGDAFRGATVEKITASEIQFRSGERTAVLGRPEYFPLLPLAASAQAAQPRAGAQPPAPGYRASVSRGRPPPAVSRGGRRGGDGGPNN